MAEVDWLTIRETMGLEGRSRKTIYDWMREGRLIWRDEDGTRRIDPLSLSLTAKKKWQESRLREIGQPQQNAAAPQGTLWSQDNFEKEFAAACLSQNDKVIFCRRFRAIAQVENCNWRAEGFPSKRAKMESVARLNGTTVSSLERWRTDWNKTGDILALIPERRGPMPGTSYTLNEDAKAHLYECAILKGYNIRNSHNSLIRYLTDKQNAPGNRVHHVYDFPSYATSRRYILSLSAADRALRDGTEAIHAAAGHIKRRYDDLLSLQRVECDEWRYNLFAYDLERPASFFRPWLLVFLDVRSIYPLVWKIVRGSDTDTRHGISEEDEIDLTERLVREYGVPGELSTDRGRFRGKNWGGSPTGKARDQQFKRADGILDILGITYNRPRKSNPRAMREHPLFRFCSNKCQGLPGYVGRNTVEKKTTRGEAEKAEHLEWAAGRGGVKSPLLSTAELARITQEWIELWRDHPSQGTDMRGLSPRAVFVHNTPLGGFRRISEADLAFATAKHYQDETIEPGGIITLPDQSQYSHPLLTLIPGQQREVVRMRHDHSQIVVLAAQKGESNIVAPRRVRVGTQDQEELARQSEMQARIEKLFAQLGQRPERSECAPVPMTMERVERRNPEPPAEIEREILASKPKREAPSLYDFSDAGTIERL